jgi:hypothetical protein
MMAANKKTKAYLESEKYAEIRQDLLDQLERNGNFEKYYKDLVDDYMDMWVTKCLLVDDIQRRGVTVRYNNGGGQAGRKKNDSIEQRIKVNGQMLRLLAELGIKWLSEPPLVPSKSGGEEEDDPL